MPRGHVKNTISLSEWVFLGTQLSFIFRISLIFLFTAGVRHYPSMFSRNWAALLLQLCIWLWCTAALTMSESSSQSQTLMLRPSISGTEHFIHLFCSILKNTLNYNTINVFHILKPHVSLSYLLRGQSPMHILGHYGKENAAAIFELFLECMPEYPLDKPDNEGNTGRADGVFQWFPYRCHINRNVTVHLRFLAVLLLAYMKGNANLCRAIVRAGARLGITNNQGINIFNYQVATKQLLFRLLGLFIRLLNGSCALI